MKKTWILLVLAALLVVALAMPATASVTDPHCPCGATTSGTTCASCGLPVYSDWKAWDLGDGSQGITLDGDHRYYLTSDITLAGEMWVKSNANVTIDLNGYDIYANGASRHTRYCILDFYEGDTPASDANITLTDTSAQNTGELVINEITANAANAGGSLVRVVGNSTCNLVNVNGRYAKKVTTTGCGVMLQTSGTSTLNIYNAKIDASNVTASYGALGLNNSTMNIRGDKTVLTGGKATAQGGGAFLLQAGTFSMYAGTVQNGIADLSTGNGDNYGGGNFNVWGTGATLKIYGGTIKGGSSVKGGNIFNNANVSMEGGFIENGNATIMDRRHGGGNVYCMKSASVFTMVGGTIRNGFAANSGGNVCVRWGKFNMSGGTIHNDITDKINGTYGGNVAVTYKDAYFNMTGGTVSGGYANNGASIAIVYDGGNVDISGNAVIKGGKANNGGAIHLESTQNNPAVINIKGGTITGGEAGNGGVLFIAKGTANISGGTITGGTISNAGGALHASGAGVINMTGGDVTGGTANYGAAVAIEGGTFQMSEGTLTGGNVFGSCGGTISLDGGTVTISGGTVYGGTVPENAAFGGGTFAIYGSGTMNVSGGTINAGTAKRGSCGYIQNGTLNITGGTVKALSKFGGTVNVSGAPDLSIALGNNQSFNIPTAITKKIEISCDDWTDVIAVAASKAVADASKEFMGKWAGAMVIDGTSIRLQALLEYNNGAFKTAWAPGTTLAGGEGVTYKLSYDMTRKNLDDVANKTAIDLNGFTLTLNEASDLSGIVLVDSSAAGYTAGTGKIAASSVSVAPERVGLDAKTNYRYVTVLKDGYYTSHRIYVTVKSAVLYPVGPNVYFKTVLKCDEELAKMITAYGASFTGDNTVVVPSGLTLASGNNNLNEFVVKGNAASAANFGKNFSANAYITIADDWTVAADMTIDSSSMARSVESMVEYANTQFDSLTVAQQNALVGMYKKYSGNMTGWAIDKIVEKANAGSSTT